MRLSFRGVPLTDVDGFTADVFVLCEDLDPVFHPNFFWSDCGEVLRLRSGTEKPARGN